MHSIVYSFILSFSSAFIQQIVLTIPKENLLLADKYDFTASWSGCFYNNMVTELGQEINGSGR